MNNLGLLSGLLVAALTDPAVAQQPTQIMTLEEIFTVAESQSDRLRVSRAAEHQAALETESARMMRLPDISSSLSLSYIADGFTTARDFSDRQKARIPHLGDGFGVTVTQPVYAGGAISGSIDMARLRQDACGLTTANERNFLRMSLTSSYLELYKCLNQRRVLENNIAAARRVLADMHARHDQGTVLMNDITRYELVVSDLELALTRVNNTMRILNYRLVSDAGLPDGTVVSPDTTILVRSLESHNCAWWQSEAEIYSPRLGLARSEVAVSHKAEQLARAERLPHVGLKAAWTIDGPILVEVPPIDRNLSYWYVGVGVTYNISSLYKTRRKVAASRAATVTSQLRLEDISRSLALDVTDSHIRYQEAVDVLASRYKAVELAERNYSVVATRYGAGMALVTDLLDAANSRLDAERQLVNARVDIIQRYYQLLFISGKL